MDAHPFQNGAIGYAHGHIGSTVRNSHAFRLIEIGRLVGADVLSCRFFPFQTRAGDTSGRLGVSFTEGTLFSLGILFVFKVTRLNERAVSTNGKGDGGKAGAPRPLVFLWDSRSLLEGQEGGYSQRAERFLDLAVTWCCLLVDIGSPLWSVRRKGSFLGRLGWGKQLEVFRAERGKGKGAKRWQRKGSKAPGSEATVQNLHTSCGAIFHATNQRAPGECCTKAAWQCTPSFFPAD